MRSASTAEKESSRRPVSLHNFRKDLSGTLNEAFFSFVFEDFTCHPTPNLSQSDAKAMPKRLPPLSFALPGTQKL